MAALEPNPRSKLAGKPWSKTIAGDVGAIGGLVEGFEGLEVRDGGNDGFLQVIEALEVAENAIKQQMEENNQLKSELHRITPELERYRLEANSIRPVAVSSHGYAVNHYQTHLSNSSADNNTNQNRVVDNGSSMHPQGSLLIHQNGIAGKEVPSLDTSTANYHYHANNKNGALRNIPEAKSNLDNVGASQFSTPSRSFSPSWHQIVGDYDQRFASMNDLIPISENPNILWKQVREQEEEIAQLRKHLAEFSVKEAQIRNEKYVLEARITNMRRAFDQQQQDLVDAATKAITYRQEIIEENIRLTYALQACQAEKSIYVSSLVPLLSEQGFQPAVFDAQSIVSSLKVLIIHMQEKLLMAEEKLKESQYLPTTWQIESTTNAVFTSQSPSHPLNAQYQNSLEIVPQPAYANPQSPISYPSNFHTRLDMESTGNQNQQPSSSGLVEKNQENGTLERVNLFVSRSSAESTSTQVDQSNSHVRFGSESTKDQDSSVKDLVRINKTDDSDTSAVEQGREYNAQWASGNTSYMPSSLDDPNSYPYLPPVLEEPISSFSEAAEDDNLPAIEELRISGKPFPGNELQASGYSVNGTTSCNFKWVRYLEDGSVQYIEGAKKPNYLVTADDVDSYLAIEVRPLDDRLRKGDPVKVFANEQRKITCDAEMQEEIKQTLSAGHVTYDVSLPIKFLDIWELGTLTIRREGYSIKNPRGVVVTEKFKPSTTIIIPYGHPIEFHIQDGSENYRFQTEIVGTQRRDTIVLVLRLFKKMALEKRKGKIKSLFFHKFELN